MPESYRNERFSFRFTDLSLDAAERIRSKLSHLDLKSRNPKVLTFDIRPETDLVLAIIRKRSFLNTCRDCLCGGRAA